MHHESSRPHNDVNPLWECTLAILSPCVCECSHQMDQNSVHLTAHSSLEHLRILIVMYTRSPKSTNTFILPSLKHDRVKTHLHQTPNR
jgi:hypothetical protein